MFLSKRLSASRRIKGLEEIQIELTSKCNADCYFCVNRSSFAASGRNTRGLSTETVCGVIDWIANSGVKRVRFTGGEPMLRPDIIDLAAHAKSRGLFVLLNTNGYGVARNAAALGKVADVLLMSIISAQPAITDAVMGKTGSHQTKLEALTALRSLGGQPAVWADTVVTEQSARELSGIYQLLRAHGVAYWFLLRAEPHGVVEAPSLDQAGPESERAAWITAIENIRHHIDDRAMTIGIGNALPACTAPDSELIARLLKQSRGGCSSEGRRKLVIDPYGHVLLDRGLPLPVGTIFDDLAVIWNAEFPRQLRSLSFVPLPCQNCRLLTTCRGGSRLAAHSCAGTFSAADPLMNPHHVTTRRGWY